MPSPDTEELAGELVAFANAEGDVVFLGVDDSGAARGIPPERLDSVEHWLLNVATHNCDPPIRPVVRKALLPDDEEGGDRILLAQVPRGLYVHRTSGGRYYTRVGSTKRDLTPPELARLFQQRGREYVFDEQPVLAAAVDDLNRNRLEAFFGRSPTIPWLDLLRNTRVTFRDEDAVDRPTVAGLLVFATEPTEYLASGSIEAACYSGTRLSSDDLVHAERLAGPVLRSESTPESPSSLDSCSRRCARGRAKKPFPPTISTLSMKPSSTPSPTATTPSPASKIRLFLFTDRLELYSPGKLPNTITLDDMPYRTFTRNQLLVSFLSRLRSKANGAGVPGITRRRCAEDSRRRRGALGPPPGVRAVPAMSFGLTLWAKRVPPSD